MKQPITILLAVASVAARTLFAQDITTLVDTAASATGREYLAARNQIAAMGQNAVASLEAIKAQPNIPWQRRVMARICLERIQRGEDIMTFVNYNWRNDPLFKDSPGWDSRAGYPKNFKPVRTERLAATKLAGYCFELMWKGITESPGIGGEWEQAGLAALLKLRDPDLVYWAREELQKVDPMYIGVNWAYDALLRLKDNASLPKMFELWLQARPQFYAIYHKGALERGATPQEARDRATGASTEGLGGLLQLATPADATWITQKLQGIELGDAAQQTLSAYLASAGDSTPPVITVLGANPVALECGGAYADAGATATDNKDGNITARIVVENNVDTPKVGTYQVIYRVTDAAGNAATATRTVKVVYKFDGFLAPVGGADATGGTYDKPVRTFKLGSTIPVKFQISCGGTAVKAGVHTLQVIKYNNATTAAEPIDATPTDAATTGNQFKLTGDEWHFNLDTKATGMSAGIWQLKATLSDGSTHTVWISLK